MPVYGNLASMPLPELLQWLGGASKTGTLEIERNKVRKRVVFRGGRIIACASDEPADMLGHFLLSSARISEESLRRALEIQEHEKRHLGAILVGMGALSDDDLRRVLEEKAEETIFGLFAWKDAEFRFHDGEVDDAGIYPVAMRVEDVLLRGAQRFDDVRRIQEVLDDPGIVLRRTRREPPAEVFRNRIAKQILEAIDGRRTVAEILLHAHGSEFLVTKFLFELHRARIVEIVGVREIPPLADAPTLPEPPARVPAAPRAGPSGGTQTAAVAAPPATTGIDDDLEVARRLIARGDFDGALHALDAVYRAHPGDDALRRLLAEAEADFVEKAHRHYLPPDKVLVLKRSPESLTGEPLSPAEFFLLSRIDGTWDVKSIIQITPLREVDALRVLKRMRERGIVDLRDPT